MDLPEGLVAEIAALQTLAKHPIMASTERLHWWRLAAQSGTLWVRGKSV
jgi:hypothetical protein